MEIITYCNKYANVTHDLNYSLHYSLFIMLYKINQQHLANHNRVFDAVLYSKIDFFFKYT